MANGNGVLHAFERNRFYYGKLMDVRHWTIEQEYGIEVRQMLSRLGLGCGVLCGLGVSIAADGGVWIEPGVAIDGRGREIVVTERFCLQHPEQPTDCLGHPDGDPVREGEVTIGLCYHECLTEPAPAIACGCDTVERCEPGMIEERFAVCVTRGAPGAREPFPCDAIFPTKPPAGFDRRHQVFDSLGGPCPPATGDCVTLATVAFVPDKPPVVDPFTYRRVIYSNQTLFELILCLAARVDACCGGEGPPPPHANPPRVMRMWPRDRQLVSQIQNERDSFLKSQRLELIFERTIAPAALADPDPWLRMWSFSQSRDRVTARRVGLTHKDPPGAPPILTAGPGEQLAVYVCDAIYRREAQTARVLVQLRPKAGANPVVVDTGAPALLLDGEHHGTSLTQAQLDDLWDNATDQANPQPVDAAIWPELLGPGAPFPTGDGTEGGNLDLGFAFAVPAEPAQPRLRAVWPPNASYLRPSSPSQDEKVWGRRFREEPHIELTFDKTLDVNQLGALDPGDWVRTWCLTGDPRRGTFRAQRVRLDFAGPIGQPTLPAAPDTVTIALKADIPFNDLNPTAANPIVTVVRGDPASVDADFQGFAMDPAAVADLWDNDNWSGPPPAGPSSIGAQMFDGAPGGTAKTFFNYAADA
jgi:hypothetical protein